MAKNTIPLTLLMSAMAITAASCSESNEDPNPDRISGNGYASQPPQNTPSSDITVNNLTSFNVYAYTGADDDSQPFMDNVIVTKPKTNVWTYTPLKYW